MHATVGSHQLGVVTFAHLHMLPCKAAASSALVTHAWVCVTFHSICCTIDPPVTIIMIVPVCDNRERA